MKKYINPFSAEFYVNDEAMVSNHEELRQFLIELYNESPAKEGGNFYGTGLTSYFYDDFTSHLDIVPAFSELRDLIIEESKLYILNRAKELELLGATTSVQAMQEKLDNVGLELEHLWFNVNPYGGYQGRHHHASNLLGGTYYLQIPKDSGKIAFTNPNPFAYYKSQKPPHEHLTIADFDFKPTEGTLLLWPGWADHEISVNNNKTENRMTISFAINWRNHAQDI